MDDPLTTPGPPPSYALESDSDSEPEWDDESPSSVKVAKPLPAEIPVVYEGGRLKKGGEVVCLVGEAGEWVAKGVVGSGGKVVGKVLMGGEQVASIEETSGPTIVFVTSSIPLVSLHPVSSLLLTSLTPKSTFIISSYHSPSYLSSSPVPPSFLFLTSSAPRPSVGEPYSPPNLLHGLASSLFTLSSLSPHSVPTTLLLLPTTTLPPPPNGPFPLYSTTTNNSYDAGGPTDLSEGNGYKKVESELVKLNLSWWKAVKGKGEGKGFEWLEGVRKAKRREMMGSMYM